MTVYRYPHSDWQPLFLPQPALELLFSFVAIRLLLGMVFPFLLLPGLARLFLRLLLRFLLVLVSGKSGVVSLVRSLGVFE